MKKLLIKQFFVTIFLLSILPSCKAPDKDPIGALNKLVGEYGFIGYQNPLEESKTGTMLSGRPTSLAYIANSQDCFPDESIERFYDRSNFTKKYEYNFKGNLGFLVSGNPIVTAGAGVTNKHYVQIELTGITIEYMSSIDITRWYNDGLDDVCKNYLDKVGFVIQAISANKMKLSITDSKGGYIKLDASNISTYFGIQLGVEWNITNSYFVEISTPKYIGYQLGSLRAADQGMSLNRAMSVKKDQFVFETIALFDDLVANQKQSQFQGQSALMNTSSLSNLDQHSIYLPMN